LPTSTAIALTYDKNLAGTYANSLTLINQSDYGKLRVQKNIEAGSLQMKLSFTASGNNAPEVIGIYCQFNEQNTL